MQPKFQNINGTFNLRSTTQKNQVRTSSGKFNLVPDSPSNGLFMEDLHQDLEAQNDELIGELHEKVLNLKQMAYSIRQEVQESNTLLDKMTVTMLSARHMLGASMIQLQSLSSYKNRRHIWTMMIFFVFVLFMLYLFFGKGRY